MDTNHAVEFEDFRMDTMENFPEVDFSFIKLNLGGAATSSLVQTSSEDVNIKDDATTQPNQDDLNADAPLVKTKLLYFHFSLYFFSFLSFLFGPLFWTIQCNLSTFISSTVLGRAFKQLLC